MKKKLKFILILVIFSIQLFSLMPDDPRIINVVKENLVGIDPLRGYPEKLGTTNENPSFLVQQEENEWILGETVKVNIDSQKSIITEVSDYTTVISDEVGSFASTYSSDDHYHFLNTTTRYDVPAAESFLTLQTLGFHELGVIYILNAKKPGTIFVECKGYYDGHDNTLSIPETTLNDTAEDAYISHGSILLRIVVQGSEKLNGTTNMVTYGGIGFLIYNYETSTWDIKSYTTYTTGSFVGQYGFERLSLWVDHVYYDPNPVNNYPRSEYQQTSTDLYLHKIKIENFDYNTEISVYHSLSWNYSHINPSATTGYDSSNIFWVNDTIPVTYEIYFTSGVDCGQETLTQKQYLAISTEKSYDMEGELPDHQIITSSTGYDGDYGVSDGWSEINYKGDNTLNSTIVSNGAFSLRMDGNLDSPNYRAYLGFYVPYGEYYFSFDYYVESSDGTLAFFEFFIADSGTVVSALTLDQTANRWHKGFAFGNCKYTYYSQAVVCVRDTSDFVVFFDNIKFWQVNHEVFTSGYQQIKVSGQMISWDGYDNPPVPNEDIELELRDRTADTSIVSDSTKITDSSGNFEWIIDTSSYSELQDQREIEVRSYSLDSWFGLYSYEQWDETSDFSWESGGGTISEDSTISQVGGSSIKFEDSTGYTWPMIETIDNDLSNIDYMVSCIKSNISDVIARDNFEDDAGTWYLQRDEDDSIGTSWIQFSWDIDQFDYGTGTSANLIDVEEVFFVVLADSDISIWWDGIRFIQAQKSYFTPLKVTDWDFAQSDSDLTWGEDGWGWSDGVAESDNDVYFFDKEYLNGYFQGYTETGRSYTRIEFTVSWDTTYWNVGIVRVWINDTTDNPYLKLGKLTPTLEDSSTLYPTVDEWVFFEVDLSSWTAEIGTLFVLYLDSNAGAFTTNATWRFDFAGLIHRDAPVLSVADSYAYLSSSNNSFSYRTEIDSTLQGYHSDLMSFSTDQTVGSHTINCTVYDDSDRSGIVFLPGTSVTSSYTVAATAFSVSIESFSLSDNYVNTYITASKDGSYTVYENDSSVGSGSFVEEGTIISHSRDSSADSLINLAYKFTNGSDTVWFNTSYSNARTDFYLTAYSINIAPTISITWSTSLGSSTITVIEDGSTKVSDSGSSPATYSKSTSAGIHAVTCRWDLSGYPSVTHSFTYEVTAATAFSVTVNSFYLTDDNVYVYISATKSGDYYIYENDTSVATGSFYDYGTTIQHTRNSTSNIIIELCYRFINGTDEIWFNSSYSNPLSMLAATFIEEESNQYFEYGVDTLTLNWTIDQLALMIIWVNGSYQTHASGVTYIEIILTPYFQSIGVYNFTVEAINQYDRRSMSTMFLTVRDTIPPTLIIQYTNGTTFEDDRVDTTLSFASGESVDVEIYRNTTLIYSDTGATTFNGSIGTVGEWNITVIIEDINGNSNSSYLVYTIQDTTAPEFLTYETTIKAYVGSSISQKWSISDLNPDNYTITLAGIVMGTGTYTSSVTFSHTFTSVGTYTLSLTVEDDYGNIAVANTIITVELPSEGEGRIPVYPTTTEERVASGFEIILGILSLVAVIIIMKKKRRCSNEKR